MKNRLKQISLFSGIALIMLAAFPLFAQEKSDINKTPLNNFGKILREKVNQKEVDLSENFLVEVSGGLTKEGKFDSTRTEIVRTEGSEQLIEVGKDAINAINDSGILVYLSRLDVNKINVTLAQNDSEMYAVFKSETPSSNKAKVLASTFNMVIAMGKSQIKDDDTKVIFDATSISVDGNSVIIKTAVEKSVGQEMIKRQLAKGSNESKNAGNN